MHKWQLLHPERHSVVFPAVIAWTFGREKCPSLGGFLHKELSANSSLVMQLFLHTYKAKGMNKPFSFLITCKHAQISSALDYWFSFMLLPENIWEWLGGDSLFFFIYLIFWISRHKRERENEFPLWRDECTASFPVGHIVSSLLQAHLWNNRIPEFSQRFRNHLIWAHD